VGHANAHRFLDFDTLERCLRREKSVDRSKVVGLEPARKRRDFSSSAASG
jgi:hypothetical protein